MGMAIITKGSISMECLRGSESIFGQKVVLIKVILSKDRGAVMGFGKRIKIE
jgi:hypothetical protein